MTAPWTPHAPRGCPPWNPLGFVKAVDMGLSLRGSFVPAGQKDSLRGFGSRPHSLRSLWGLPSRHAPAGKALVECTASGKPFCRCSKKRCSQTDVMWFFCGSVRCTLKNGLSFFARRKPTVKWIVANPFVACASSRERQWPLQGAEGNLGQSGAKERVPEAPEEILPD